ncbi:hypothetical protein SESBI_43769 [Sesbania bispinosa]|nr:hypothetical protein SESBI_43769 [Sesbania bispinosa]
MLERKHVSQIQIEEIKQTRDPLRGIRPPRGDYRGRKLEIPIFSGDDAYGWINRVERYFKVNDMDYYEKLGAVLVALEDRALNWYHWWEEQTPSPSWVQFKEAVIRRFQPNPIEKREPSNVEKNFLNGLREELQVELKLYNMGSLSKLIDRALLLEEKNWALKKGGFGSGEKASMSEKGPNYGSMGPAEPKPLNGSSGEKKVTMGRRLSQAELQERSRKGLCFKYGEKWGPEHECKLKHYQLALTEKWGEEEPEDEDEEETQELEHKTLQLFLKSKVGLTSHKSFKIWGSIGQRGVLILVDYEATNSFLSRKLVAGWIFQWRIPLFIQLKWERVRR